jgi:hypothetical protein
VQQSIVQAFPKADMSIAVVWMDVLPLDSEKTARKTAGLMSYDPRLRHFHDPDKRVGKALAKTLKWEGYAWDIYVFYDKGTVWRGELPPAPADYVHQLGEHSDDGHFHHGEDLTRELHKVMTRITAAPLAAPAPAKKGGDR